MKSSILTGITLTLLMLLLVSAAAFVFLFQGRETLQERADRSQEDNSRLQEDLKQTATDLAGSEATRTVAEEMLGTAESDLISLEGQLLASHQEVEQLTGQTEMIEEDLAEAQETIIQLSHESEEARLRQPVVEIVAPEDESVFLPNETVELVVSAGDAGGISAVSVTIDGEPLLSHPVEDKTVHTILERWTPDAAGSYTISALAANNSGLNSEPVTVTIQVIDINTQNRDSLRQIEAAVTQVRGLELPQPVEINFLTEAEASSSQSLPQAVSSEPSGTGAYLLALSAFDFLQPDYDLPHALAELGQTTLAVHDPEALSFTYLLENGQLDPTTLSAHGHQFIHALQAQHHPLDLAGIVGIRSDAADALNALIEGEVELVERLYRTGGLAAAEEDGSGDEEDALLQEFPPILVNQLRFIHTAGFDFAEVLYQLDGGGFSAIDSVWQDPPKSTEQILHPERYQEGDEPISVSLPPLTATLGAEWELRYEDTLGELFLREYLLQQLTEEPTIVATTGWGGDRYAIYFDESQQSLAMALRLVWDSENDSSEFAVLYPNYPARLYDTNSSPQPDGSECWQGDDVICFSQSGLETVIARAPDLETAVSIILSLVDESG